MVPLKIPVAETEAQEEAEAPANGPGEWTAEKLDDYYGRCKPVQRAILDRIAEAGEKGTLCRVYDEVFNAAKAVYEGDGEFTRSTLQGNFSWLTKYSHMVGGNGDWPGVKSITKKDDVWYLQMEPATAKTILRLRAKYEVTD